MVSNEGSIALGKTRSLDFNPPIMRFFAEGPKTATVANARQPISTVANYARFGESSPHSTPLKRKSLRHPLRLPSKLPSTATLRMTYSVKPTPQQSKKLQFEIVPPHPYCNREFQFARNLEVTENHRSKCTPIRQPFRLHRHRDDPRHRRFKIFDDSKFSVIQNSR